MYETPPPFSPKHFYYQYGSEWPEMHFKHNFLKCKILSTDCKQIYIFCFVFLKASLSLGFFAVDSDLIGPTKPLLLSTLNQVLTKVPKKTPHLRGEQSEPLISTPLSWAKREKFPFHIPLTGAHKSAKKTTTFERWEKRALNKYLPLSRAKREKFPFHIPHVVRSIS